MKVEFHKTYYWKGSESTFKILGSYPGTSGVMVEITTSSGYRYCEEQDIRKIEEMFDKGECSYKPFKKKDILGALRKHIENSTPEQLRKEWDEIEKLNLEGPKAEDFFNMYPRDPCEYCGKQHLDYACDEQVKHLKSKITTMTMKEYLLDTVRYYAEDPQLRRNKNDIGGCDYYPTHEGTEGCAIGRKLCPEDAQYIDAATRDPELDLSGGIDEVMGYFKDNNPDLFPQWMWDTDIVFLERVQQLHDNDRYWDEEGLSPYGFKEVTLIIMDFNLDIDPGTILQQPN